MNTHKENCGAEAVKSYFLAAANQVAGATAAIVSASIDRQAVTGSNTGSVAIVAGFSATLADTKTLALKLEIATSTDDSTYTAYSDLKASTVLLTGTTGGSTETGVFQYNLRLADYARYFKVRITPTMTATSTDTLDIGAVAVDTGNEKLLVTDNGWNFSTLT